MGGTMMHPVTLSVVPEWMTIAEAAKHLKVSRMTIYRWMASGELPYYKLPSGGGRRLRVEDLDKLLRRKEGDRS